MDTLKYGPHTQVANSVEWRSIRTTLTCKWFPRLLGLASSFCRDEQNTLKQGSSSQYSLKTLGLAIVPDVNCGLDKSLHLITLPVLEHSHRAARRRPAYSVKGPLAGLLLTLETSQLAGRDSTSQAGLLPTLVPGRSSSIEHSLSFC